MADLGALTTVVEGLGNNQPSNTVVVSEGTGDAFRPLAVWEADMFNADLGGTISGVVTEYLVPLQYARVYLYWRKTGYLINSCLSAEDGSYSFSGLNRTVAGYMVVAITDRDHNAIVYDKLTPV